MTLQARDWYSVPQETARVAQAAFPKGNVYMTMRDQLDVWYKDSAYGHLFESHRGRPAESPGRLNLILVMQFAEGLSDRQAADAVRSRIDWKYALGLPLTDPGFDASVLSLHRQRLIAGGAEQQLLDDMLEGFRTLGLLKARGQQRTDSTHVLAAIRSLNRLECIGETMRQALNHLAEAAPEWLLAQVSPDWFDLYSERFEEYRLPKEKAERYALAERIGADGYHLLAALYEEEAPDPVRQLPAVEVLRQVWLQQFMLEEGQVRWRSSDNLPPAERLIISPYDLEARLSQKRQTRWSGYKVHLTETCDEETPHLITQVETTPATTPDCAVTADVQADLATRDLLPETHLLDAGYMDVEDILNSRDSYQIEMLGPVRPDPSWQTAAHQGFDSASFAVDWEACRVTCPQGSTSISWHPTRDRYGNAVINVKFDPLACLACAARSQCTRSKAGPRALTLKPRAQHAALQHMRAYQQTAAFKQRYRTRAGIEGTISQGTRSFDLRRTRYLGLAKTHLQHILTAAAINLTRAVAWLMGKPRAHTRRSQFARLAPAT